MAKDKKPEITPEKLGENLFLGNLKISVNKLVMSRQFEKDRDGVYLPVEIEVERDVYCRVYSDSGRRMKMVELSKRGKDLYLWLIYEVEEGIDHIWINKARYMKECEVKSYNTYRDAVNDLIRKNFIAATAIHSVYWLNPHYFFCGSRINAFPEKVVKR